MANTMTASGNYTPAEAIKARLEKEILPGEYVCIAILPYNDALAIQEIMQRNHFEAWISCRCGNDEYGGCEACNADAKDQSA